MTEEEMFIFFRSLDTRTFVNQEGKLIIEFGRWEPRRTGNYFEACLSAEVSGDDIRQVMQRS